MREQFGLRPKQQSVMYRTPYPPAYDQIPLPLQVQDFWFHQVFRTMRCFHSRACQQIHPTVWRSSQSGPTESLFVFSVFVRIGLWLVHYFAGKFHFILGQSRETISSVLFHWDYWVKVDRFDRLRQRNDELVAAFIQRFRDVKNRCYSLVLSDQQLADAAFNGLLPHIKDNYASQ